MVAEPAPRMRAVLTFLMAFFPLVAVVNVLRQEWWLVTINLVGFVLIAVLWTAVVWRSKRGR